MRTMIILVGLTLSSIGFTATLSNFEKRIPKIVQLKAAGYIGEQADGLLGVIQDKDDAAATVQAENEDRRALFKERSGAKTDEELRTYMNHLGASKIEKEPKGFMIKNGGSWIKK